jgi:dihydrolipoamide dehydrogenase
MTARAAQLHACNPHQARKRPRHNYTPPSTRDAGGWGLTYAEPEIDLARLNAWKDGVVATMTGGLRQLARARKITCVEGTATFVDAHTLRVSAANDAEQELSFEHAIIATGSRPTVIPTFDIDSDRILDSTSALALRHLPESMLVVGGDLFMVSDGGIASCVNAKTGQAIWSERLGGQARSERLGGHPGGT